MEFKGTKGKWKYYKAINSNKNKQIISTIDGRGLFISGYHSNPNENEANALLISKAPEMLQALITTLEELEDINVLENHRNYIEQLIKQATEL